ncbi:MAG: chromosomal replication initiator protein DnaA [Nitrospinota bacterium]
MLKQNWDNCLLALKEKINPFNYESWIEPIKYVSSKDKKIVLEVPSQFYVEWIRDHYLDFIKATLEELIKSKNIEVDFLIVERKQSKKVLAKEEVLKPKVAVKAKDPTFVNERYKFDNFVVGKSNEFCFASAKAVASKLGSRYNPLFIYGGVGLGKTHLLHAIGNAIIEKNSELGVLYVSSEKFVNDLITSLQRGKMNSFRNKYRSIDLLLVDDIQFISGKERTQEEFFHTFNTLFDFKKQIVLSSDKFPKDINNLEERLRSRFAWGLISDIQPPELEIKIAIVKNIIKKEGFKIDDEVSQFLANKVRSNIRELEGILARVMAFASLTGRSIDIEMAKETLKGVYDDTHRSISIEQIQKVVANYFKVKVSDLKSKQRTKMITTPRHIAFFLAREYTGFSLPEIGKMFGNRDHTTVIHAITKIKNNIEVNTELYNHISKIKLELGI